VRLSFFLRGCPACADDVAWSPFMALSRRTSPKCPLLGGRNGLHLLNASLSGFDAKRTAIVANFN
jgi:hypothetical protein